MSINSIPMPKYDVLVNWKKEFRFWKRLRVAAVLLLLIHAVFAFWLAASHPTWDIFAVCFIVEFITVKAFFWFSWAQELKAELNVKILELDPETYRFLIKD